uniref:Thymidine kinase n=1 Tax=Sinocyclocheilus anshuiensis TaxID=1608454 RepID=A0A671L837_9TELE
MDCLNVAKILPNSPRKIRGQIQVAQYSCLVIKYAKDTQSSRCVCVCERVCLCVRVVDDLRPLCLQAFGNILNLVPLAESVVKLNAVCMQCFKEAAYTKRLGAEQEVEVIGGTDKYHAVCRACYGGLVACKENCDPQREETPPHVTSGKQPNQSAPRKLFASLHL